MFIHSDYSTFLHISQDCFNTLSILAGSSRFYRHPQFTFYSWRFIDILTHSEVYFENSECYKFHIIVEGSRVEKHIIMYEKVIHNVIIYGSTVVRGDKYSKNMPTSIFFLHFNNTFYTFLEKLTDYLCRCDPTISNMIS